MKTLITSLFFLSLTTLLSAQNETYLEKVLLKKNALQVEQLQIQTANFDITTLSAYEKEAKTTYDVTFKNPKGKIVATYNSRGFIIKTVENHLDVKSPLKVRIEISKKYPGWYAVSNVLKINYSNEFRVRKELEMKIKKGDLIKILSFDFNEINNEKLLVKN
jgi:hypothetical protein